MTSGLKKPDLNEALGKHLLEIRTFFVMNEIFIEKEINRIKIERKENAEKEEAKRKSESEKNQPR